MSENRTDVVFRSLREQLLRGRWATGQRLPSERALAAEYDVNRVTVRAAVGRLSELGLVTVRRGDGIRAAGPEESAGLDLITHLLEASAGDEVPLDVVRDLLEIRRMVAAEAVALACARAGDEHLAELGRIIAEQAGRVGDPEAFRAGDVAFGRAVLAAAGNGALQLLLNTIERFYSARPEIGDALLADPAVTLASYGATVALIAARDPEQARRTIRTALEPIDTAALRRLEEGVR